MDLLTALVDHLLKAKKEFKTLKETGDLRYIYRNELDKACFQHDMAYGNFKDFAKRTASDKVLRDNAFNIAENPKYDGNQRDLASMVYKFFDEKSSVVLIMKLNKINNWLIDYTNQLLENLKKEDFYSLFKDNIWGAG